MNTKFDDIPLNRKNIDGSINSFYVKKQLGHGYSIPISHPKFRSQIEDKIWPGVEALVNRGYFTVTSCEGHSLFSYYFKKGLRVNSGPQISIKLNNQEETNKTIMAINSFSIKCARNNTMRNPNIVSIRCRFSFLPMFFQRLLLNHRLNHF